MKHNKMIFIIMIAFSFLICKSEVFAETATGHVPGNYNGAELAFIHSTTSYKGGSFNHSVLRMGGSLSYCLRYDVHASEGVTYESRDAVSYFQNSSLFHYDRATAEEIVKKLGVAKYFIDNYGTTSKQVGAPNLNLSSTSKFFVTNNIMWRVVEAYRGTNHQFWMDSIGKGTEDAIMAGYNRYYDLNKDLFTVKAYAWLRSDGVEADGWQSQLTFNVLKKNNYDYSLDMACVNCDSTLADSKAVVLQDTTNWEAIEASPRMTGIRNAPTYFYKSGYGTFCREEYHFFFPNQNDKIKVQLGRYFTLNAKQEDLNVAGADIPNFKPIKVKKIRQCRKGDLNKFNNDSFDDFSSCAPDIEVYYKNENVYEYNKDCSKKLEKYTVESATSEIKNNQLTQTAIFYYTLPKDLPKDTYRYVQKFDGKSVDFLKEDVAGDDLKVGNFPVAFKSNKERNKANEKIIDIKFTFSLNSKCNFSKFYKAYTEKNDYFSAIGTAIQIEDNIYKKYINGKSDANNNINDSACVKLFGSASAARSCIYDKSRNSRTINKMGRCFAEFPKTNGTTSCRFTGSSYACMITDCSPTDPDYNPVTKTCNGGKPDFCDETTAGKGDYKDLVWDPIKKVCGTCTKDTVGTGIYKGLVWDEVNQKCAPKPSDKCELDCPTYNGEKACCEDASGRSFCGLFIGKKKVCPGKPGIPNMSNLVFRQIDKNNPFTAQDGGNRQTGDNWCDSTADGLKCDTKNNTVTTVIKNASTNEKDAMYYVKLDSAKINAIRSYNNKNNYDDFTLTCDKDTNNCIMSDEVYNLIGIDRDKSTCDGRSLKSEFSTCVKTK